MPIALGIILAALRAGEIINWPWVWVLSPLWVLAAVNFALMDIQKFMEELANERERQAQRDLPKSEE